MNSEEFERHLDKVSMDWWLKMSRAERVWRTFKASVECGVPIRATVKWTVAELFARRRSGDA